jgi:transposase
MEGLKMRLYVFTLRWMDDEADTYIVIEANTQKEAEKKLKKKLKEKEYPIEFEKYNCKKLNLEDGFCMIN